MKRVNTFVDYRTELVKGSLKKADAEIAQESSSKRAGDKLEQESIKKQKVDKDKELLPDEEELAVDAIPLATKPPRIIMAEGDIDNLTMEKYLALTRGNQAPGVVKPVIGGNVLDIVSLFNIPRVTHDAVMLRVFPITLTRAIKRYCPSSKIAKQLEEICNFKQEGDETLYQAWERHAQALTATQTMADHSQKWHDGSSSRNIDSSSNSEGITGIIRPHLDKECPINEEVKSMEEVKYGEFEEKQNVSYYVEPYKPPILFPRRLEHHAEEALVHETMESLKKIRINRSLLKEIRQTENYAKHMKDLVANKPKTEEDNEVRMNPMCSALLQNQLPLKEQDLGSFILPCSIKRLHFNNALADLGASISVMPFSMYKRLCMGKLEPINMIIEMTDNIKYTPKGIIENLLVKIDKFIFPIDFVILDMVGDFRMPIILGRPLIATAHAKVRIKFGRVCKMTKDRILKDYWREKFNEEHDDIKVEDGDDLEECGEDKANTILGVVLDKLEGAWFNGTSEEENDLEGIIDYLEPKSYDGFDDIK
ncbi:hypothetical protein Tco_1405265 [Tanacetum coccineum]